MRSETGPLGLFTCLARTGLFLEALQRECLSPHALSFAEYSVLRVLQGEPPPGRVAPSRLAEQVLRTTGAMTKIVDRLEKASLVERFPDPDDRRGVLVGLTARGDRLGTTAAAAYQQGRERILALLAAREAAGIATALERLLEVFEDDRSSG